MGFDIDTMFFSKRNNSTAIPPESVERVTVHNVLLKEETSLVTPTFILQGGRPSCNYVYAPTFQRYYWVTDITSIHNDIWSISCRVDAMASYRSFILNTSAFCTYSSNGDIYKMDGRIAITTERVRDTTQSSFHKFSDTYGTFVLTTRGASLSQTGGMATSYACYYEALEILASEINGTGGFQEYIKDRFSWFLDKATFDFRPWDYIVSCSWLPVAYSDMPVDLMANINLGGWNSSARAKTIQPAGMRDIVIVQLPTFAGLTAGRGVDVTQGRYRSSAYRSYQIYLPYVGLIDISADDIMGAHQLYVEIGTDVITGDVTYIVRYNNATGNIITKANTNISVKLPVSANYTDYGRNAMGALATLFGVATGDIVTAGAGLAQAVTGGRTQSMISGGYTGRSELYTQTSPTIYVQAQINPPHQAVDAGRYTHGLPDYSIRILSSVSGYVQCQGASVSAPALEAELEEINGFLNGGAFIE